MSLQREPPVVEKPLLLLDYDGTLAEIADEPERAFPHARVPKLLGELTGRFPVRVITGRRIADLARLLDVPGLTAVGVHGMEEGQLGAALRGAGESSEDRQVGWRLDQAELEELDLVRAELPPFRGVRVEDKGAAVALHYRGVVDEERVVGDLRNWSERLPATLESVWGKKVLEVRPRGYDKGRAARELAAEHPEHTAVMIGDDTTDEDAFRALRDAVTIKVGDGETAARYRLRDVAEVVAYLERYLE
jgi:trehalose 6-phosphate phosphatase